MTHTSVTDAEVTNALVAYYGDKTNIGSDYLKEQMRRALEQFAQSRQPSSEAVEWQSIDTAPKDGTRFLAFQKATESQRYECWWQDNFPRFSGWQTDRDDEPEPTHWMVLPPAPSTAAIKAAHPHIKGEKL